MMIDAIAMSVVKGNFGGYSEEFDFPEPEPAPGRLRGSDSLRREGGMMSSSVRMAEVYPVRRESQNCTVHQWGQSRGSGTKLLRGFISWAVSFHEARGRKALARERPLLRKNGVGGKAP